MKNESAVETFIARDAPYHRAPPGLRERVHASLAAEAGHEVQRSPWRPLALAASFLLVGIVSWNAALWQERSASPPIDEAVDAHVRSLATPGRLIDVPSSDRHTEKPWFIGKVDLAPPVTDFAEAGFPLAGGRLDHLAGRSAAALVYRHGAHVVNVFITSAPKAPESAPEIAMRRGYALAHWRQGGLAFEAVGDISAEDMNTLVGLIRKG